MSLLDDGPLLVDLEAEESVSAYQGACGDVPSLSSAALLEDAKCDNVQNEDSSCADRNQADKCRNQAWEKSEVKATVAMTCLQAVCSLALTQRRLLGIASPQHQTQATDFATARLGVAEAADVGVEVLPSELLQQLYKLSEELPREMPGQVQVTSNPTSDLAGFCQGRSHIEAEVVRGRASPNLVSQPSAMPSASALTSSDASKPRQSPASSLQRGLKRNVTRDSGAPLQARQHPVALAQQPVPNSSTSSSSNGGAQASIGLTAAGAQASIRLAVAGEELEAAVNDFVAQVSSGQRTNPQAKRRCENDEFMRRDFAWCEDLRTMLRQRFGYADFRGLQMPVINAVLSGKDIFAVMPTGAGKSLCYQIPAMYRNGTAVVVSPLLALMLDQVQGLKDRGIQAARLGSDTKAEDSETFSELAAGRLQLLYVSPERLVSSSTHSQRLTHALQELHRQGRLSFFCVDEAHCVSQWGLEFRSNYRQLSCIRRDFPGVPIMALTASATEPVEKDVIKSLRMHAPVKMQDTFDRPNLFLEVRAKKTELQVVKEIAILARCGGNRAHCGIVYALSRDDTQRLAKMLCEEGITSRPYHAGLAMHVRNDAFEAWKRGVCQVIVATVAFGMGIDKRDVRFVCHVSMTSSIERYHQEIGRAGRDGGPCRCIAWHSHADLKRLKNFTTKKHELQKIDDACRFFTCANDCRRMVLLRHFGERSASQCGACDICARQSLGIQRTSQEYDMTEAAKWLLEMAVSLEPHGFTAVQLRDTARGKQLQCKSHALMDCAAEHPLKGKMSSFSVEIVDQLIQELHALQVFQEHRAFSGKSRGKRRFMRAAILHVRLGSRAGQLRSGSLAVRLSSSEVLPDAAQPASKQVATASFSAPEVGTCIGKRTNRNLREDPPVNMSNLQKMRAVASSATNASKSRSTPSNAPAYGQSPLKRARTIRAGIDDQGAVAFAKSLLGEPAMSKGLQMRRNSFVQSSITNVPVHSATTSSTPARAESMRATATDRVIPVCEEVDVGSASVSNSPTPSPEVVVNSTSAMASALSNSSDLTSNAMESTSIRKPSRAALRNQARQNPVEYDI